MIQLTFHFTTIQCVVRGFIAKLHFKRNSASFVSKGACHHMISKFISQNSHIVNRHKECFYDFAAFLVTGRADLGFLRLPNLNDSGNYIGKAAPQVFTVDDLRKRLRL